MDENVRAHIVINGIVQGVFFRVETQRTAIKYGVNGWVRNKPDGSVEAVIEGDRGSVESMITWCRKGPERASVEKIDIQWQDYKDEFTQFKVTH